MSRFFLTLCTVCAFAAPALGQRNDDQLLMMGVGFDHVVAGIDSRAGDRAAYLSLEYGTEVWIDRIDLRGRIGTDLSPYGAWVGAGISLEFDLFDTPLYLEGSVLPGVWADLNPNYDMGHWVQFRSQVGLGWHLDDDSSLHLGLSHKSNANIPGSTTNPGLETLQLRYTLSF